MDEREIRRGIERAEFVKRGLYFFFFIDGGKEVNVLLTFCLNLVAGSRD